jgi:hypothetical protein
MSWEKTSETCLMPRSSVDIVIAMMNTNQKTSLPRRVAGV